MPGCHWNHQRLHLADDPAGTLIQIDQQGWLVFQGISIFFQHWQSPSLNPEYKDLPAFWQEINLLPQVFPSSSPLYVKHLQAVAGAVGIVLRDVVESGQRSG
ncbi:MAG: hypothetical protein OXD45_09225 [Rhodobacteraceae bacterium]|nr:hypothetical protein [Paracoccaceae bacterium]